MGLSYASDGSASRRAPERRIAPEPERDEPAPRETPPGRPKNTFTFRADLDMAELDERGRPGASWAGKAVELSRSHLVFRSRRMCYQGRELLVAVHLIDDRPTPLFGCVARSEYDGDGLYRTHINLQRLPETDAVNVWIAGLAPRGRE